MVFRLGVNNWGLMTSLTFVDLAKEVVEVYERFEKN
ncbi:lichenan-specific phosphotransferase enzyme iia component (pts system lichenan-specific eiia component) (eiia-lic) (eiii-lic) [Streptococcus pneumoniae]|nr:lichenan-specific phosphotransferase enzyme iia component (pts system lichenan-specific eiia component) (eiia-lic) (eiii-lic) [Streptococcus pneumoniae]CWA61372.1 lichenan-specific phosphotransferase enzyme iia component (pts system lichenan-specific eiia component) (eiia-lic) (eiii-lic) [Streptococcus pneumoniae]